MTMNVIYIYDDGIYILGGYFCHCVSTHAWLIKSVPSHNISICNEENRLFTLTKSCPSSMYIKLNLSLKTKENHLFAQTIITSHGRG